MDAVAVPVTAGSRSGCIQLRAHNDKDDNTSVRLQGLRQKESNSCEAVVVGHDGSRVQVHVTQGPENTGTGNPRTENQCRADGTTNDKQGPPATAPSHTAAG